MGAKSLFKKTVNLITLSSFLLWNLAAAVPEGGTVVQGNAAITQSGTTTTINQTSQNAVINWHGFDTAAHESVQFNQPNSSAIALNRITSGLPTSFNGSLSANGQVWIINPNGIVFGSTSQINVAGLLATTHGITDANFMSGNYKFTLDPNFINSQIINNGTITIADNGMAALVGPMVANNGTIIATLGKVYLSSGATYVLDMYGDELINFGTNAPIANASVSNSGLIQASGGKVHMTANVAAEILETVISMSGTIEAKSAGVNQRGEIVLFSSDKSTKKLSGVTRVTGKLDASDGGFIETSGEYLQIEPSAIIHAGAGGSWLLDPNDITINAGGACTGGCPGGANPVYTAGSATTFVGADFIDGWLSAGGSVTLNATGNITISSPLTFAQLAFHNANLVLNAGGDITMNAPITNNTGVGVSASSTTMNFTATGNININAQFIITNNDSFHNMWMTFNAGNQVHLNAPMNLPNNVTAGGGYLNVTAPGGIFINTPTIVMGAGGPLSQFTGYLFNSPVILQQSLTITEGTNRSGFLSTVNPSGPGISLTATGGTTTFDLGDVGTTTALSSISISSGSVRLVGSGTYHTTGNQNYSGLLFYFGANTGTFTSDSGTVTIGNGITANNGSGTTQINGNLNFTGTMQGAPSNPPSLGVTGTTTFNNATIKTNGNQDYHGVVTLNGSNTFSTPSTVHFYSAVNGPGSLTSNASFNTQFDGVVGVGTALAGFTMNGPVTLNAAVITVPTQTYSSTVTVLAGGGTLNASTLARFTNTSSLRGPGALTINGNAEFDSNVGAVTPLASLSVTGSTSGATVTTSGNQLYSGPFTLLSTDTLTSTAGSITFGSTVNGPFGLTVNAAVGETFTGAVGSTTPLSSLDITINNLLTSAGVTFSSTLDVSGAVTINATGSVGTTNMLFNGAIGSLTPLGSFNISTNALANNTNININSSLNVVGAITVNATSAGISGSGNTYARIGFSGPVGNLTPSSSLSVTADAFASDSDAQIQLPNSVTVNGPVTLHTISASAPSVVLFGALPLSVLSGDLNITATSSTGIAKTVLSLVDVAGAVNLNTSGAGFSRIEFHDNVGSSISPTSLTISGSNITLLNNSNNPTFSITTVNDQQFNSSVTLSGVSALISNTGNIAFGSAVNGGFGLSASVPVAKSVTFTGAVSGLTGLNITGDLITNSTLATAGNIFVSRTARLASNVSSGTGTQEYVGAVTLTGSVLFSATNNLYFDSSINSDAIGTPRAFSTNVNQFIYMNGVLGGTFPLLSVNQTNADPVHGYVFGPGGTGIFTTTTQAYNSMMNFEPVVGVVGSPSNPGIFVGNPATFTLSGSVYTTGGPAGINGGTAATPITLTFTTISPFNDTFINGNASQTYNGALVYSNSSFLTNIFRSNGNITFNGSVNSTPATQSNGIVVQSQSGGAYAGTVTFNGPIGATTPVEGINITGGLTIFQPTVGSIIHVTGPQAYGAVQMNNLSALTFQGSAITFNGAVVSNGVETDVTIPNNLIISSTGSIGQGVGAALKSLTVNGTTNGANNVTTDLNQLYNLAYTVSGNSTLTSTNGSISFNTSVAADSNGTRDLGLVAALPVSVGGNWSSGNLLRSLTIGSIAIPTQANISTAAINTTVAQIYNGPVLFQSLPAINLTSGLVTFNKTVNSLTTSTAMTISGNLTVDPVNGSIGQQFASPGNAHVGSITVTGTTHGPNTTTSGDQNWGPIILTSDETFMSTAGNINFNNTVDGGFNLIATAAGAVKFDNNVGASSILSSLVVNAGTNILINPAALLTFSINTNSDQTYTGNMQLTLHSVIAAPSVPMDTLHTATTGNITLNGPVSLTNINGIITFVLNAAGNVNINNTISMNPNPNLGSVQGGHLIATAGAGNKIFINTPTIDVGDANDSTATENSVTFNSPVILQQSLLLSSSDRGSTNINSTIDSTNTTQGLAITGHFVQIFNNIGVNSPLAYLTINSATATSTDRTLVGSFGSTPITLKTTGDITYGMNNNPQMILRTGGLVTLLSTNGGTITIDGGMVANAGGSSTPVTISGAQDILNGTYNAGTGTIGTFTVIGTTDIEFNKSANTTVSNIADQIYIGNVIVDNGAASLTSTGSNTIDFQANVNGVALGNSGTLTTNSFNTQFEGVVNGLVPLTSLSILGSQVTLNGGTLDLPSGTQVFGAGNSHVLNVLAAGGTINDNGTIQFNNQINGPGSLTINDGAGDVAFNGSAGTALNVLTVNANAISQIGPGFVSAAVLITATANGTDFSGATNHIGTFNAINTTSGPINLTNTGALSITGISQSGGGNLTIVNAGDITQPSGIISVAAPGVSSFSAGAANSVTLNQANLFAAAVSFSNTDSVLVNNAENLILGTSSVGANLTATSTGTIAQTGMLTVPGTLITSSAGGTDFSPIQNAVNTFSGTDSANGVVNLNDNVAALIIAGITTGGSASLFNTGTIGQTAAITANSLTTSSSGGTDLSTSTNVVNNFGAMDSTGGTINLNNNTAALTITGITTTGGAVVLTNTGSIDQSGAITSDTLTTSSAGGTDFSAATNVVNTFSGTDSASGVININDNVAVLTIAGIATGGSVSLINTGTIGQTAVITANSLTTSSSGGTILTLANGITVFNATNSGSGDIDLTNSGALSITGISQTGGALNVNNAGAISQTAAISVSGASSFSAGSNPIDLATNGGSNNFQDVVTLSNSGANDVQIFNNNTLTLAAGTNIGGNLTVSTNGSNINLLGDMTSGGTQTYNDPVVITNVGPITFSGSDIIFIAPVSSTGTPAQITIAGNLVIGNASSIGLGLGDDVSSLTVSGTTRDGGDIITTNDPIFGGAYFLTNNVTITDLSVVGITFTSTVDNDAVFTGPWNLTLNVSPLGTVTFGGDVGTLNGALQSLTVNGTSSFSKGSLQTVNTVGSQTYSNTVTLNNDVTMASTGNSGVVGTDQILFGYGAAGVNGPGFTLTATTQNSANGPFGLGIQGTMINLGTLVMGGTGGGDISPIPYQDSIVSGFGGNSAWTLGTEPFLLTLSTPANFFCVNSACIVPPVPPVPPTPVITPVFNVPPTEIFNVPYVGYCDASGCTNLDLVNDNLVESGVVSCAGNGCPYGFVEARDMNGRSRILMQGDIVYVGDTLYKDKNSCVCVKSISGKRECYGPGQTKIVYDK